MIIAISDGSLARRGTYTAALVPITGVRDALLALKHAGHVLVLWTTRTNRAHLVDATLDPLVRAGIVGDASNDGTRALHAERLRQLLAFVDEHLKDIFDSIDDGMQGKIEADIYIDDRAVKFGGYNGLLWPDIAMLYGET